MFTNSVGGSQLRVSSLPQHWDSELPFFHEVSLLCLCHFSAPALAREAAPVDVSRICAVDECAIVPAVGPSDTPCGRCCDVAFGTSAERFVVAHVVSF